MTDLSIDTYLQSVPEKFSPAFQKIRGVILEHLPQGYLEEISYGMIGYVVPLSIYPLGYLKKGTTPLPIMNLGYQKNHIALYHYGIYTDQSLYAWFINAYANYAYPHKINIGKSCIRFQYMDEIPYALIGDLTKKITVEDWIQSYNTVTGGN
jgi:hypothetical protein